MKRETTRLMGRRIAYLFDIDGTLLMCGGAGRRAFDRALATCFGFEAASSTGVEFAGQTDPLILDRILTLRRGDVATAEERETFYAVYVPCLEEELKTSDWRLVPGVHTALDFLGTRGGLVEIGVATGNIQAGANAKLRIADLHHRFSFGGFGDDHPLRAELVARALTRCGPVDHVVVVGDTSRDVAAARAVGALAVGVTGGGGAAGDLASADVIIHDLVDLPAWHTATFEA